MANKIDNKEDKILKLHHVRHCKTYELNKLMHTELKGGCPKVQINVLNVDSLLFYLERLGF